MTGTEAQKPEQRFTSCGFSRHDHTGDEVVVERCEDDPEKVVTVLDGGHRGQYSYCELHSYKARIQFGLDNTRVRDL